MSRRNVEIKCRVRDRKSLETVLEAMEARHVGTLIQRDVFFNCANGRLKLRFAAGAEAELIHYQRSDSPELRGSDYQIATFNDGASMLEVLSAALGRLGEVHKTRNLYLLDNIRIHLDEVENLGSFLELEAVVDQTHPEPNCHAAAQALLRKLGITPTDIVPQAYIDLLPASE